ncbi:hypothetical protein [Lysobacter auxotrophicus]|nr:hypothetical protein [Lysobacter auxotrophicus]
MAHAIPLSSTHESIDAGRIAANTGTLLVNGALLLLLLVPLSQRVLDAPAKPDDAITIVHVRKIEPVDPPPPVNVQITTQPPTPVTHAPPAQPVVAQIEQQVVDSQPGDIAIEPSDVAVDEGTRRPNLQGVPPSRSCRRCARRHRPIPPKRCARV